MFLAIFDITNIFSTKLLNIFATCKRILKIIVCVPNVIGIKIPMLSDRGAVFGKKNKHSHGYLNNENHPDLETFFYLSHLDRARNDKKEPIN